jgi:hypothetical protein
MPMVDSMNAASLIPLTVKSRDYKSNSGKLLPTTVMIIPITQTRPLENILIMQRVKAFAVTTTVL